MKHLQNFDEHINEGMFDFLKKKKAGIPNIDYDEEGNVISPFNDDYKEGMLFIDQFAYDTSQFGQSKYRVYLSDGDKFYYLGDVRKFEDNNGETTDYISYLKLDNIKEVKEPDKIITPLKEVREIINNEIDKEFSNNLMDDMVSYREYFKQKYNINLKRY